MSIVSRITNKDYSISGYKGLLLILYHITDANSARAIEASQMMKPGSSGMLGGGIYFADTKEAAQKKAQRHGVVLKCLVKVGKIMVLKQDRNTHITHNDLKALGVNSIKGVEYRSGSEYVVYKPSQVWAAWVVEGAPQKVLFPADNVDTRQKCKRGEACTRRDPVHFKLRKHPLAPKFPMDIPTPKQAPPCSNWGNCRNTDIRHFKKFSHSSRVVIPGIRCPYGSRCYRKNPNHFKKYKHPKRRR